MNLYDDLPSPCSSDTEALDSTPLKIVPVVIPEVNEIGKKETPKEAEIEPEPDKELERSPSPDPPPKEEKPVTPSLQFIPPALRAKALHTVNLHTFGLLKI